MFRDEGLPEELTAFEAELAALRPVVSRLNRDRLMYRLGAQVALGRSTSGPSALAANGLRASLRRPAVWQAAALLMACSTLVLGARLLIAPRYVDRVVYVARQTGEATTRSGVVGENTPVAKNATPVQVASDPGRRPKAVDRWLLAVATPDYRWAGELRARPRRDDRDPSAPILVGHDWSSTAIGAPSAVHDVPHAAQPLRWSDERTWVELLGVSY
ncbi:MAG: hypothetical protein K2Y37_09125 [Pirellulales bacterium]|nr:hypothetical protein [Pirellulales bacterium]